MKKKIIKKLKEGDNKKIFSNFVSLSFLQGANLILPLITFPYLVRTLGIEKYGLIMFAQAFMTYFSLIADYGFNLSGTREVSLYRNNFMKLTRIYNSILFVRLGLTALGFIIMVLIVFSIEKFAVDWKLYFLTYGMIIGTSLFPTWLFQGMEKMKYITILSVISKLIFTILIFVFITSSDDYLWVPLLNTGGSIFVGVIALVIINRQFGIPFKTQKMKYIFQQLQKGRYIFISKISTNLYTATTTFVLGLVANTTMVGYYVIAEKVIRVIVSLFMPFSQAIYPYVVKLASKSTEETVMFSSKIIRYTLLCSLGIWLVGIIFAEPIFLLVFGNDIDYSIVLFRILSPLIIILPLAVILFNIVLLSFKMDKYFFKIYTTGAILNIFLLAIFLFILELSTVGAAISLLICEISITVYAVILLNKNNIKLFSFIKQIN
jgi:O-antigen/teichoic acid export membrane protein